MVLLRGNCTRSMRWKVIVSSSRLGWVSGGSGKGLWGEVHELEADVGEVERLGGVGEVNCGVHGGLWAVGEEVVKKTVYLCSTHSKEKHTPPTAQQELWRNIGDCGAAKST